MSGQVSPQRFLHRVFFRPKEPADTESEPLSAHLSNWQSAEEDLSLTRELVQEEVDQGWVFAYPGSLDEAQKKYPAGVAIGKFGRLKYGRIQPGLTMRQTIQQMKRESVLRSETRQGQTGGSKAFVVFACLIYLRI